MERIPTKSIRFYYERDRRSNTMENPKVGAHTAGVKSRPHRQTSRAPTMVMMMTDDVFIDEVDQFLVMTINNFISFLYISLGAVRTDGTGVIGVLDWARKQSKDARYHVGRYRRKSNGIDVLSRVCERMRDQGGGYGYPESSAEATAKTGRQWQVTWLAMS
ncbi:hypothetical protein FSOLCH5_004046 [Fusarium solani]